MRVLGIGLLALLAARMGLSFATPKVVDVGYASVIGASRIMHGQPLYWAAAAHADTYGPIAYLAYVPFVQLFPWHGTWDYLLSAHVASAFFDLVTIVGLVVIGRRLRPGREGSRLGLALGWAWAACPFTLLGLMMHTNDGLVAMLSVLALVAFTSPSGRGALLGLAAAAKFSPAALLPLFAAREQGVRRTLICVASFAAVTAVSIGLFLPSGGVKEFYDHTIGYQLTRTDVFSAWALHPNLAVIKTALEIAALLLAGAVALVPARRTMIELCALAGAVTIAVQLPAIHWFYYYIIWFLPFALIALITPRARSSSEETPAQSAGVRTPVKDTPAPEPALAGV